MNPLDLIKRFFGAGPRARHASADDQGSGQGSSKAPMIDRRRGERLTASPGLRVLIIDDSPTIVAILGRMLRQNGFVTSGAGDAESGIAAATAEKPDLIFLDIVLPGMSGFNALRHLRRQPETRDIPIVMISGNAQATEQFYVQRIGADDFMKKPFGRGEVFARIAALIENGRLPDHAAPKPELLTDDGEMALPDPPAADAAGEIPTARPPS